MKNTVLVVEHLGMPGLVDVLRRRGLHVLRAKDLAEACDIECCEGIGIVVLEEALQGVRGIEFLRRIRGS